MGRLRKLMVLEAGLEDQAVHFVGPRELMLPRLVQTVSVMLPRAARTVAGTFLQLVGQVCRWAIVPPAVGSVSGRP